jgi:hypothetical protein
MATGTQVGGVTKWPALTEIMPGDFSGGQLSFIMVTSCITGDGKGKRILVPQERPRIGIIVNGTNRGWLVKGDDHEVVELLSYRQLVQPEWCEIPSEIKIRLLNEGIIYPQDIKRIHSIECFV